MLNDRVIGGGFLVLLAVVVGISIYALNKEELKVAKTNVLHHIIPQEKRQIKKC